MKILLTLASLDIGGAETHVAELAAELYRRGHNVIVASGGGVYADELEKMGIKHYTLPLTRRKISDMLISRKMLKKIIREEAPDIVHAHARIPAFLVSTLQRCCNFVFVTSVHGAFDTSFILRHLSGWGCKTLAVSEDLKQYLLDNYNVLPENIYTSINGISTEKFNKDISCQEILDEFGFERNDNRVCYVSRLTEGICSCAYMLIDRFEYISKSVENFQLVIVGDGEHYDALKKRADIVNNRIGRRGIVLTGARTDVNKIIAASKVCVGVSRAILEPMAMERLCIVAGDPGYIGIISEDKLHTAVKCNFTCRGCESVDEGRLADDIIILFNMEEDEATKLKRFAGEVVRERYSIDAMVSDNERMYADAMREHSHDAAILGYYGYGNCGDDALLEAILCDISAIRPYFSPTILSAKPAKTAQDYGVRAINRFNIFAVNRLFKKTKLFIAGGGSLVQDVTSTKSLFYYLYIISLAKKRNLPVMLYGNGIGPINKPFNRRLAAKVLNGVDVITLRDFKSAELLKSMGVTAPQIKITADPALGLECGSEEEGRRILSHYGLRDGEKFFCMSVRKWRDMGDTAQSFADICDMAYEKFSLVPVILPMQYSKDIQLSLEVAQKAKCRCIVINESLSAERILSVMGLSEAAVAVRLHILIFGTLLGKPVLGVDYDPKVSSFLSFVGQNHCLSAKSLTEGTYKKSAEVFFENYPEIARSMGERLTHLKEAARENARIAVELIEHE